MVVTSLRLEASHIEPTRRKVFTMGGAGAELDGGAAECGAVRRAIYWSGSQKPLESCSDLVAAPPCRHV